MYRLARRFNRFRCPFTLAFASAAVAALCRSLSRPAPRRQSRALRCPTSAATAMPVHANGEHPAVRVARMARRAHGRGIDANAFIVQPPACVRRTFGPEAGPSMQVAGGAGTAAVGGR